LGRRIYGRSGPAAPERQAGEDVAAPTGTQMASPDKIDNRRGQRKCFSDTELERWTQTHRPVRLVAEPVQRLGVVEPQHHEPEEYGELVAVPPKAAEEQPADREGEGPGEEVASPVGETAQELPVTEVRGELNAVAGARKRADVAEQGVVVHQRKRRRHVRN